MLPKLTKLVTGQYKNIINKFAFPNRDPETGLFIINYNNPMFEGKIPPKPKKKKRYIN